MASPFDARQVSDLPKDEFRFDGSLTRSHVHNGKWVQDPRRSLKDLFGKSETCRASSGTAAPEGKQ